MNSLWVVPNYIHLCKVIGKRKAGGYECPPARTQLAAFLLCNVGGYSTSKDAMPSQIRMLWSLQSRRTCKAKQQRPGPARAHEDLLQQQQRQQRRPYQLYQRSSCCSSRYMWCCSHLQRPQQELPRPQVSEVGSSAFDSESARSKRASLLACHTRHVANTAVSSAGSRRTQKLATPNSR